MQWSTWNVTWNFTISLTLGKPLSDCTGPLTRGLEKITEHGWHFNQQKKKYKSFGFLNDFGVPHFCWLI